MSDSAPIELLGFDAVRSIELDEPTSAVACERGAVVADGETYHVLTPDEHRTFEFETTAVSPENVAFDGEQLYVALDDENEVRAYQEGIAHLWAATIDDPRHLAVTDDRLVVLSADGTLTGLDPEWDGIELFDHAVGSGSDTAASTRSTVAATDELVAAGIDRSLLVLTADGPVAFETQFDEPIEALGIVGETICVGLSTETIGLTRDGERAWRTDGAPDSLPAVARSVAHVAWDEPSVLTADGERASIPELADASFVQSVGGTELVVLDGDRSTVYRRTQDEPALRAERIVEDGELEAATVTNVSNGRIDRVTLTGAGATFDVGADGIERISKSLDLLPGETTRIDLPPIVTSGDEPTIEVRYRECVLAAVDADVPEPADDERFEDDASDDGSEGDEASADDMTESTADDMTEPTADDAGKPAEPAPDEPDVSIRASLDGPESVIVQIDNRGSGSLRRVAVAGDAGADDAAELPPGEAVTTTVPLSSTAETAAGAPPELSVTYRTAGEERTRTVSVDVPGLTTDLDQQDGFLDLRLRTEDDQPVRTPVTVTTDSLHESVATDGHVELDLRIGSETAVYLPLDTPLDGSEKVTVTAKQLGSKAVETIDPGERAVDDVVEEHAIGGSTADDSTDTHLTDDDPTGDEPADGDELFENFQTVAESDSGVDDTDDSGEHAIDRTEIDDPPFELDGEPSAEQSVDDDPLAAVFEDRDSGTSAVSTAERIDLDREFSVDDGSVTVTETPPNRVPAGARMTETIRITNVGETTVDELRIRGGHEHERPTTIERIAPDEQVTVKTAYTTFDGTVEIPSRRIERGDGKTVESYDSYGFETRASDTPTRLIALVDEAKPYLFVRHPRSRASTDAVLERVTLDTENGPAEIDRRTSPTDRSDGVAFEINVKSFDSVAPRGTGVTATAELRWSDDRIHVSDEMTERIETVAPYIGTSETFDPTDPPAVVVHGSYVEN